MKSVIARNWIHIFTHRAGERFRRAAEIIRKAGVVKAAVLVAVLLTAGSSAHGEEQHPVWSDRDISFAMLTAYAAIDYDQSAGLVTPGGALSELNPVIGEHPTRQDMLAFGAVGMGLLYLASKVLPEPWDRIVVDSAVTSEGFNIEDNVRAMEGRRRIEATPIIITVRF